MQTIRHHKFGWTLTGLLCGLLVQNNVSNAVEQNANNNPQPTSSAPFNPSTDWGSPKGRVGGATRSFPSILLSPQSNHPQPIQDEPPVTTYPTQEHAPVSPKKHHSRN